jgi:hypothetical protein
LIAVLMGFLQAECFALSILSVWPEILRYRRNHPSMLDVFVKAE